MAQHILPGDPALEIHLKRSGRARRMSLRVSRLDGRITLTIPQWVDQSKALEFAREKQDWLREQAGQQSDLETVSLGSVIPVLGRDRLVAQGQGRRVVIEDATVRVPGDEARIGPRLKGHLKQLARSELSFASDQYSQKLGMPYNRITIRDTRSRWGSCTTDGGLMYSWRLIMAPPQVLTYVAAHEVAHLAEMNHSAAFWDKVRNIYGDFEEPRAWLRENGHELHRFRFGD